MNKHISSVNFFPDILTHLDLYKFVSELNHIKVILSRTIVNRNKLPTEVVLESSRTPLAPLPVSQWKLLNNHKINIYISYSFLNISKIF